MLTLENLRNNHFISTGDKVTYSRRVHDNIFLEYDTRDGFITIVRFLERPKHNVDHVDIIFPHKIDSTAKLQSLANLFDGNFGHNVEGVTSEVA